MSGIRCVSDLSKKGERNYSLESWIVIVWNVSCLLPITPCRLGRRDGWHFRLEFVSNNWLTPHPPPLTPHPSPLTPHPPPPTPHPLPLTPHPPPLTPGIDLPGGRGVLRGFLGGGVSLGLSETLAIYQAMFSRILPPYSALDTVILYLHYPTLAIFQNSRDLFQIKCSFIRPYSTPKFPDF